ncbi:sigma-54-dependent transcriptional regulator [Bacteroidota bacterium]
MKEGSILIIDDNQNVLTALNQFLETEIEKIFTLQQPETIPDILKSNSVDVILMDMNFSPGKSEGEEGIFWLDKILSLDSEAVVILFTAYGEFDLAVKAIKKGAIDFIVKPWDNAKLLATIKSGIKLRKSRQDIQQLKNKQKHLNWYIDEQQNNLIGDSLAMKKVFKTINKVAKTDSNVLILGENGTGKELIAREIHKQSLRADEVFIHVDMGAMTESLFESELFGHVKGAFTDAITDKPGRFEIASGGTLFLDEIGNIPPALQAKLLNVLQNRQVYRIGSNKQVFINIRLICATNKDPEKLIEQKLFREDLYYRINTIEIEAPPLRERGRDIVLLADFFLEKFTKKYNKPDLRFTGEAYVFLQNQLWQGNIRQLQNVIEKSVILSDDNFIRPEEISPGSRAVFIPGKSKSHNFNDIEKSVIINALNEYGGNVSKTARELGVSRSTIYNKKSKYKF